MKKLVILLALLVTSEARAQNMEELVKLLTDKPVFVESAPPLAAELALKNLIENNGFDRHEDRHESNFETNIIVDTSGWSPQATEAFVNRQRTHQIILDEWDRHHGH